MNNHTYHQQYMQAMKKLHGEDGKPCDRCAFTHECKAPDHCTPYQIYVETGESATPPRQLPTGD